MWRELWSGFTVTYYRLFQFMEEQHILDVSNELHMQVLHFVFLPRMQLNLDRLTEALKRDPYERRTIGHYYNFGSLENTWTLNVIHRLRYMWNQMINLVIDRPFYNFLFFLQLDLEVKIWLCDYYVNYQCKIFESLIK